MIGLVGFLFVGLGLAGLWYWSSVEHRDNVDALMAEVSDLAERIEALESAILRGRE